METDQQIPQTEEARMWWLDADGHTFYRSERGPRCRWTALLLGNRQLQVEDLHSGEVRLIPVTLTLRIYPRVGQTLPREWREAAEHALLLLRNPPRLQGVRFSLVA